MRERCDGSATVVLLGKVLTCPGVDEASHGKTDSATHGAVQPGLWASGGDVFAIEVFLVEIEAIP
jgi:hypothetical protein